MRNADYVIIFFVLVITFLLFFLIVRSDSKIKRITAYINSGGVNQNGSLKV